MALKIIYNILYQRHKFLKNGSKVFFKIVSLKLFLLTVLIKLYKLPGYTFYQLLWCINNCSDDIKAIFDW